MRPVLQRLPACRFPNPTVINEGNTSNKRKKTSVKKKKKIYFIKYYCMDTLDSYTMSPQRVTQQQSFVLTSSCLSTTETVSCKNIKRLDLINKSKMLVFTVGFIHLNPSCAHPVTNGAFFSSRNAKFNETSGQKIINHMEIRTGLCWSLVIFIFIKGRN